MNVGDRGEPPPRDIGGSPDGARAAGDPRDGMHDIGSSPDGRRDVGGSPDGARAAAWVERAGAIIRLGRPHFLAGGLVLYALGAAVALAGRRVDVRAYVWGQAAITATQLMTHYANDYFDLEADRANPTPSPWSGGSRVLPNGALPPIAALAAALVLGACALGLDAFVALRVARDPAVFAVLALAAFAAWEYSAPPLRLHARGAGPPATALVVTVLTPLAAYLLQGGGAVATLLVAVVPAAFAQAAMILVIDFPDAAGDRAAGKGTLVVRLGGRAAARLAVAAVGAPYAALPVLVLAGLPARAAVAVLATLPVAAVVLRSLLRGDWGRRERWPALTWWTVAWFALLTGAELAAFASLTLAARS